MEESKIAFNAKQQIAKFVLYVQLDITSMIIDVQPVQINVLTVSAPAFVQVAYKVILYLKIKIRENAEHVLIHV